MSERRPDPPDVRASVVDSGWSEPETQPERILPVYEDAPREALITRVDDQIQSRLDAMRRSGSDAQLELPAFAAESAYEAPPLSQEATLVGAPAPAFPPLPPAPTLPQRSAVPLPFPSAPPPPLPSAPPLPFASAPPPPLKIELNPFRAGPGLGEALAQRVHWLGTDLPLWGILVPALLSVAVLVGLVVHATSDGSGPIVAAAPSANSPAAVTPPGTALGTSGPSRSSGSLLERAAAGEPAALATLEGKRPRELRSEEALALASGRIAAARGGARKLRERLASDPGLAKDSKVVFELLRFAQDSDTRHEALMAMAALPGPISADLLYEVWTGTAERSGSTELARALLLGPDVRPRASPALAIALDLREAETCEASAKLLARAAEVGDKRSFAPLSRLLRRTGCGPGKKQDCYPCLRGDDALKRAMGAVKLRREPDFLPK